MCMLYVLINIHVFSAKAGYCEDGFHGGFQPEWFPWNNRAQCLLHSWWWWVREVCQDSFVSLSDYIVIERNTMTPST